MSGGSAKQTADLCPAEKVIQLEEAHARATVALTRARRLCVLLCPLDQRGSMGAATILGCLQYGLGLLSRDQLAMPLWKEAERLCAPSDAAFLNRLERMTPFSLFPPVSLVMMRPARGASHFTLLRLHLVVVDTHRTWTRRHRGVNFVAQFLPHASAHCTPMSAHESILRAPYHNDRFAFGYARDNSTFPMLLLYPVRRPQEAFVLVDTFSAAAFSLDRSPELKILPLVHFYDAFRAVPPVSVRAAAAEKFGVCMDDIASDLTISKHTGETVCWPDVRDLGPDLEEVIPARITLIRLLWTRQTLTI